MRSNRLRYHVATVCAGLSVCWGCVERDEVITVAPDGSVTIELEYEVSEKEMAGGDAMPSAESGWKVVRSTKKEGDEIKHILKSKRRFAAGEPLPRNFAAPNDPDADLYLQFPTTVRIERRRDGTYYYFHRVYTPRRWAYVRHWQDEFIDDNIKKLGDKPVEELTFDERVQIALGFASVEAFKQIEFVKEAAAESGLDLPVEHWLIARRAMMNVYMEKFDVSQKDGAYSGPIVDVIRSCEQLLEPEREECLNQEAERILASAYDAYVQSLRREAGLSRRQIAAFERAYARAKRYYKITELLGGHTFDISVIMPGTIIAHNAIGGDEVEVYSEESNTSGVEFMFEGDWFRDRPYELIVVSRVENQSAGR